MSWSIPIQSGFSALLRYGKFIDDRRSYTQLFEFVIQCKETADIQKIIDTREAGNIHNKKYAIQHF